MSTVVKRKNIGNGRRPLETRSRGRKHYNHIKFEEVPSWISDNEFILSHHRPELNSFKECLRSIFGLHSETGNIWTHLLGLLSFVIIAIVFYIKPFCDQCSSDVAFIDKFVFIFFFLGAISCLSFSMMFHTVLCHSEHVYKIFSKLDYVGISILTIGSFIPWIYYGFYCDFLYKVVYISTISVLAVGTIFVTMIDKFATAAYRPVRATLFVCIGLFAIAPFTHFLILHGWEGAKDLAAVKDILIMACLYISGAVLYGARIPERFMQGRCDLWLQSHQIFHTLVVAGAAVQFYGMRDAALYRLTEAGECPQ
eukprot:TRINITY_DN27656_c0_g1_i1.p1 TRINITY_DN27656_c0_g1~~TRINITY_DN27656_c0_g1_i1.p1  ORF type:complete len:310 (-),score=59.28 TRINITY_DN27656_c0_g1_i1:95-1024(-)